MDKPERICSRCGKQLPRRAKREQIYCSGSCANQATGEKRRSPDVECLFCGKAFRPKGSDRKKCCGRECGLKWSGLQAYFRGLGGRVTHRVSRRKCFVCGCGFTAKNHSQRRCIKCSVPEPKNYYKPIKGTKKNCKECRSEFVVMGCPEFPSLSFCSKRCANAVKRRTPWYKDAKKAGKDRRRARIKGAAVCESVSPIKVFSRDGWRCGICGRKTLKDKRGTSHPRAPELDHIVALANGGDHSYQNTQCACRECNRAKGATDFGQIPLFRC